MAKTRITGTPLGNKIKQQIGLIMPAIDISIEGLEENIADNPDDEYILGMRITLERFRGQKMAYESILKMVENG